VSFSGCPALVGNGQQQQTTIKLQIRHLLFMLLLSWMAALIHSKNIHK